MSLINSDYTVPSSCPFFYGRLLREESNIVLEQRGCQNGLFLLRELVAEVGSYALSICFGGSVHHYRIERQSDGTVQIEKGPKFIGPVELIKHHQIELDGLITKPLISCDRPKDTNPIYYLFVNDSEVYKLVNDEINVELSKTKSLKTISQYNQDLIDARGRLRYKYERIILKRLHFSQPWFKANLDRKSANEMLRNFGSLNGQFLVRSAIYSNDKKNHDEYRISMCFNNEIKHYKIKSINEGENIKYCLDKSLEFDSIIQLVDYYHRKSDGLVDILRIPLLHIPSSLNSGFIKSLSIASLNNSNKNKNDHSVLKTENIYDSNRMHSVILNLNEQQKQENSNKNLDDEPINSSDITNLSNIPESKRNIFELNENCYEFETITSYAIDLKDITCYDKLGSGCFGSVYRGTYKLRNKNNNIEEVPVAIKQLNIDTDESKKEIIKEAKLMKSLINPHIIKFIGMCFQSNGSLMIVLELAKLGPLHKYLRTHAQHISIIKIVKICYQIALAMQYLSSKNLVHRDLAARNVLLVSQDLAKVSDFGMSRRMGENKYYETHLEGKWPLKWYPPDAITHCKFDEKSDVWSFGVTCWEALTFGGRPYQGIDIAMLLLKLENGHRLEKPLLCPDEMYNIMYRCWSADKRERPSFEEIVKDLKKLIYDLFKVEV